MCEWIKIWVAYYLDQSVAHDHAVCTVLHEISRDHATETIVPLNFNIAGL